jgi:hypothetical protein
MVLLTEEANQALVGYVMDSGSMLLVGVELGANRHMSGQFVSRVMVAVLILEKMFIK